jgi:hypothetical protein
MFSSKLLNDAGIATPNYVTGIFLAYYYDLGHHASTTTGTSRRRPKLDCHDPRTCYALLQIDIPALMTASTATKLPLNCTIPEPIAE